MNLASSGGSAKARAMIVGRATGGPVQRGRPYIVGERRPELFIPSTSGRIEPSVPSGIGGGGRWHPHDIQALAEAIAQIRPVAIVDRGNLQRELAVGL